MSLGGRRQTWKPVFHTVSYGFRTVQEMRKQKCDCNPVIAKKAGEWLRESLKNMFSNIAWFSREKEHISQGVGSSCRRRGAFPWVRLTRMGVGLLGPSWQLFRQLKLSCNSPFLMSS